MPDYRPEIRSAVDVMSDRIYYRKEKLRGACWEYEIDGGWLSVPATGGERHVLNHQFSFYRRKEVEVRTPEGVVTLERSGADQWFFVDRWFSLLRFKTDDDQTVGYYVNFSMPLERVKPNYYRDLDLELDLWVDPDGTTKELDRDEFDAEIRQMRLEPSWARQVSTAMSEVVAAIETTVADYGPDLDIARHPENGLPRFILRS